MASSGACRLKIWGGTAIESATCSGSVVAWVGVWRISIAVLAVLCLPLAERTLQLGKARRTLLPIVILVAAMATTA